MFFVTEKTLFYGFENILDKKIFENVINKICKSINKSKFSEISINFWKSFKTSPILHSTAYGVVFLAKTKCFAIFNKLNFPFWFAATFHFTSFYYGERIIYQIWQNSSTSVRHFRQFSQKPSTFKCFSLVHKKGKKLFKFFLFDSQKLDSQKNILILFAKNIDRKILVGSNVDGKQIKF